MNCEKQLIQTYLNVCDLFTQDKNVINRRVSPNSKPHFSDEEAITILIFGIKNNLKNIKQIYHYAINHLMEYFPRLTKYHAYLKRLNFLQDYIPYLCEQLMYELDVLSPIQETKSRLISVMDSMPIILAKSFRIHQAKVAHEMCDIGYCSSKKLHYYGVKFHLVGDYQAGTLIKPSLLVLTKASVHDLTGIRDYLSHYKNTDLLADKAYISEELNQELSKNNTKIHTPIKLSKNKKEFSSDEKIFSQVVSSIRQSIEIFFSWIIEKTGIQHASKIRSYKGLMTHIFGKFCAALLMLKDKFNS